MKIHPIQPHITAAFAALLFAVLTTAGHAQAVLPPGTDAKEEDMDEEVITLETYTVTTGYRSPKSIDQIPGSVKVITSDEILRTQLLTDDATAVLSRTVPGYAPATQAMSNTGETLRGRVALRLFDGISQTTPLREGSRNGTFTDMDIVSRIEVINGPSASEGIGAAGGIINYISKSPTKEGTEATLRTKFSGQGSSGSFNWRVGLNYAHKAGNSDLIFGTSFSERGMPSDANGRFQGRSASGSTSDTESDNLFIKAGHTFGEDNSQRVTLTVSRFFIQGRGKFIQELGNRSLGITDSAKRGVPLGVRYPEACFGLDGWEGEGWKAATSTRAITFRC